MRRPTRRELGLALLFGVPPGVGVLGFTTALFRGETTLVGVAAGVVTAVVIGGFVLLIAVTGSDAADEADGVTDEADGAADEADGVTDEDGSVVGDEGNAAADDASPCR